MWGNALGWTISAVIVVLTVTGVVVLNQQLGRFTAATEFGTSSSNLAPIALPIAPTDVLPPRESCDAGELYRRAIDVYQANPDGYDRFSMAGRASSEATNLEALELVVAATPCAEMTLFTRDSGQIVRYGSKPQLAAIQTLGKCVNRLGLLFSSEQRFDDAIRYYDACFALGARLYEERVTLDELLAGLELMSAASAGIIEAAGKSGDSAKAQSFATFRARYLQYDQSRIKPMQRIITSIDASVIDRHTGDVFHIARHCEERMWRVEAILALGRVRYHAPRVADQRGANRILLRLSEDPDPIIQSAAKTARDLTLEQYRMM